MLATTKPGGGATGRLSVERFPLHDRSDRRVGMETMPLRVFSCVSVNDAVVQDRNRLGGCSKGGAADAGTWGQGSSGASQRVRGT